MIVLGSSPVPTIEKRGLLTLILIYQDLKCILLSCNGNVVNNCTTTYFMIYTLVVTQPDFYLMNMHSATKT